MQNKPPPPGSNEAIELGCKCPVLDNANGKGIVINGEVMYWYSQDCNIHYPENKKEDNNETSQFKMPPKTV